MIPEWLYNSLVRRMARTAQIDPNTPAECLEAMQKSREEIEGNLRERVSMPSNLAISYLALREYEPSTS